MRSFARPSRFPRVSWLLPVLLAVAAQSIATCDAAAPLSTPTLTAHDLAALDAQFAASLQQVTGEQQALAKRLDASRRLVREMFATEQEETLAFVRETRTKMLAVRQNLREEMRAALAEVQTLLASAAANATAMIQRRGLENAARVGPLPPRNQTYKPQTGEDEENHDEIGHKSVFKQPSKPLISLDNVREVAARVLVAFAHYYELFAVALVHYVVVIGLWVLLPAATIVVVLVLAAVVIAKLQAYQRARRRPRVVYSGYLRSHRQPNGRLEAGDASLRKKNSLSRKAHRLVDGGV